MSRENALKNQYAMFWRTQSYHYGVGDIEKYVFNRIAEKNPKDAFEVGIGNGFPYAKHLQENGVVVSGCDIAPLSVWNARNTLGLQQNTSRIVCGDINKLEISEKFDLVYCLRSSWYIPDFQTTVKKMVSMTRSGGTIIFDIMDSASFMAAKYFICNRLPVMFLKFYINLPEVFDTWNICHNKKKIKKILDVSGCDFEVINENVISKTSRMKDFKTLFICRKR